MSRIWHERIVAAHAAVTPAVSHGGRMKSDRYFVWPAEGSNDLIADGIHAERAVTGSTDLFSRREFDPWKEQFERELDKAGIAWSLNSVQYEQETGYWHWEWVWEV